MRFKSLAILSSSRQKAQLLAELLRPCISGDLHHHCHTIHAQSIVSGLHLDVFLNNLLLNCYSKSGHLDNARRLFDRMPQPNLISWSSMISMHAKHGSNYEAFSFFSRLRRSSSEIPNEFILSSVLRACVQAQTSCFACQVHGLVQKAGFASDLYVGTALINLYAKDGRMEEAMIIFDELPVRNSVTWTAVITGYSQIGQNWMSLKLFNQMQECGVCPDRFVVSSAISACSAESFLEGGRQIHGYAYRIMTEMDVSVHNVLIDLYSKCSKVRTARGLFDWMSSRNLVTWTTMIAGYMQNSLDVDAMDLFSEMVKSGWKPDAFACTSILNSCGSLMALQQGKKAHGYIIKVNLDTDEFVKNGLLDMYAKCNQVTDARVVFDTMAEHNIISYNSMIEGYANDNQLVESIVLFNAMRSRMLQPSPLTFVSLLGISASSSALDLSRQIHCVMIKSCTTLDLLAGTALVDVYSKCSSITDARAVFDEMDGRDLVTWNAMIFGYAQNGQGEEALKLFHQLQIAGLEPTEFTFVALVAVASNLANILYGLQFHNLITKTGVEVDPHVSNALVDMYAKCGCIKEARVLFDTTRGRDVVLWNSMICTYAQHGLAEKALEVLQLMIDEGIEPNYVTFVGILSACSHAGLVENGLSYFHSMREKYGIKPGMEHYASVVHLLGGAGKLLEAKQFIESMPIEPAAVVWRSLLSACRLSGNVELGKHAAEMAISVDPKASGTYVLFSNILASKGMWVDVEQTRKGMDSTGTTKEPGYSWMK